MALVFLRNKKQNSSRNEDNSDFVSEEYLTRIELLEEIASEANSVTDVSKLLERILRVTQHTLSSRITTLFLNDEQEAHVHSPVSVGKYQERTRHQVTKTETDIANQVVRDIAPVLTYFAPAKGQTNRDSHDPDDLPIRSIAAVPVLRGQKVIGVLVAANKKDGSDYTERDLKVLNGFASTEAVVLLVSMQIIAIDNINRLTLDQALKDGFSKPAAELPPSVAINNLAARAHAKRTSEYALMAARYLNLPAEELATIEFGALLHDIGKIGIEKDILSKPGPLTDEEWNIIYEHPRKAAEVLEEIPYLKEAANIVLYHHERYDGQGYPDKLRGEEIPLGARLVAVANAFDAMTTDRPHRPTSTPDEATLELIECTGTQFCPHAVEAFITAYQIYQDQPVTDKESTVEEVAAETLIDGEPEAVVIQVDKEAKVKAVTGVERIRQDDESATWEIAKAKKDARDQANAEAERIRKEAEQAAREAARAEKEAREKAATEAERVRKEQEQAAKLAARAEKEEREKAAAEAEKARKEQEQAAKLAARADKEEQKKAATEAEKARKEQEQAAKLAAKAEKEEREKAAAEAERVRKEQEQAAKTAAKADKEEQKKAAAEAEKARKEQEQAAKLAARAAKLSEVKAEKARKDREIAEKSAIKEEERAEKQAEKETEKAKKDNEKAKTVAARASQEAVKEAEKIRKDKEKAAKEAVIAEKEAAKARKETEKAAKTEKNNQKIKEIKKLVKIPKNNQTFKYVEFPRGTIRLTVPITVSSAEANRFREELKTIEGLSVLMLSHSEDGGHLFLCSLDRPTPLIRFVKGISMVKDAEKKGKDILVTLKETVGSQS
jgi:putative nucleotidyltransferase with HDIG domain